MVRRADGALERVLWTHHVYGGPTDDAPGPDADEPEAGAPGSSGTSGPGRAQAAMTSFGTIGAMPTIGPFSANPA